MESFRMDELAARLDRASTRIARAGRRRAEADAMTGPRLSALSALARTGPLGMAALAASEGVSASTMTRLVDALVAEGCVERLADPADRRLVRVAATAKGREVLEGSRRDRVRLLAGKLGALADSELRALQRGVELLERVVG